MAKINVSPDKDGRIMLTYYGKTVELSNDVFDENGDTTLKLFGDDLEVHLKESKAKKASKKTDEPEAEAEPEAKVGAETEAETEAANNGTGD